MGPGCDRKIEALQCRVIADQNRTTWSAAMLIAAAVLVLSFG
jgi:hypothetical protein